MKKLILILLILFLTVPCSAMTVFYDAGTGNVYDAVYDRDLFTYDTADNFNDRVLAEFEIDEVAPDNKELCKDLDKYGFIGIVDSNGDNKYYMSGDPAVLNDRDGWVEKVEVIE